MDRWIRTGHNDHGGGPVGRRGDRRVVGVIAAAASWGVFWGGWAALLPAILERLSTSERELGLALLAIPAGALPAMVGSGRLADRIGQALLPIVLVGFGGATAVVGLVPSVPWLTVALLMVGATSGAIEVALNTTTAALEEATGARLFNKVHAATPLAMVVAAPVVGAARQAGAGPAVISGVIGLLVLGTALLNLRFQRDTEKAEKVLSGTAGRPKRREATAKPDPGQANQGPKQGNTVGAFGGSLTKGTLLLLGGVAAVVLLLENAVEQWSALHLERGLGATPLVGSLGPASYMAALALGRVLAQTFGARLPDRVLVVIAGVSGCAGLGLAAVAPVVPLALLGFAMAGCGMAAAVPTILAVAGRLAAPTSRGRAMSAITTTAYLGFLSSPVLVGALASAINLRTALMVVAALGLIVSFAAVQIRAFHTHPEQRS